jgi:hypothetical protein
MILRAKRRAKAINPHAKQVQIAHELRPRTFPLRKASQCGISEEASQPYSPFSSVFHFVHASSRALTFASLPVVRVGSSPARMNPCPAPS